MSGAANSASINGLSSSSNAQQNAGRAQVKTGMSGKAMDGARKQAGSPGDGAQRKPPPNAWANGPNPITRANNRNVVNGVNNTIKSTSNPRVPVPASDAGKALGERASRSMKHAIGNEVSFTLTDGKRYTGTLPAMNNHGAGSRYVFQMVQQKQQANGATEAGSEYLGVGEYHTMTVNVADVTSLEFHNSATVQSQSRATNGAPASFSTDTAISGNLPRQERELKRFEFDAPATESSMTLGDASDGKWDQFAANARFNNAKSDYNEDMYTTKIDRSHPEYSARAARAEKTAREIEQGIAGNAHIAEERGQVVHDDSGLNEEEKYSGVRRELAPRQPGQPDRYTPPALRAPTGQASVPGAPVDPAIISSQIARPDSAAKKAISTISEGKPTTSAATAADPPQPRQPPESESGAPRAIDPASEQTSTSQNKAAAAQTAVESSAKSPIPAKAVDSGSENVEQKVLNSFKMFSRTEKAHIQESQLKKARADKAVKLNDLRKFSTNFKLNTPVPQDLIPILAKDETKQQQIREKYQAANSKEKHETTPSKPATTQADAKTARVTPGRYEQPSPGTANAQRQRQQQSNFPAAAMRGTAANAVPPRPNPGMLGQRLQNTHQQHKAGMMSQPPVLDPRIPSGPSRDSSGLPTPTSSASVKFNAKASEFRPNPAASTFQPGGNGTSNQSSPRVATPAKPEPKKKAITSFFGGKKPSPSNLSKFDCAFNVVEKLKKDADLEPESKAKREYVANGGIPQPYKTRPVWIDNPPEPNPAGKTMADLMPSSMHTPQPIPGSHSHSQANVHAQHSQQLPHHMQAQMSQGYPQHPPNMTPRNQPVQPHLGYGGQQFEGSHPMQITHSNSSTHHPSPRSMQVMYSQPQVVHMQPGAFPPQFAMSGAPQATMRQNANGQPFHPMSMGGSFIPPNQTNGPGPYMAQQMPVMHNGYPQPAPMSGPGPNGFGSPRPTAPMMVASGSQQGHHHQQPPMYVQPGMQFAQIHGGQINNRSFMPQPHQMPPHYGSPQTMQQYPAHVNNRGTPNTAHSHPMMPSQSLQSLPSHGQAPTGPHGTTPEDAK